MEALVNLDGIKIAILHPWFLAKGGAEQTVGGLAELFPKADIITMFFEESGRPRQVAGRPVKVSRWNWLPRKYDLYRYLLPFYPLFFRSLDLRGYDLILTSDSCVMKGVKVDPGAVHICYCHSPMRALFDQHEDYLKSMAWFLRPAFQASCWYLRRWDVAAARRVTRLIANSENVRDRIAKYYGLQSTVVYPPVNTNRHAVLKDTDPVYLSVGRLTRAKRIDLAIEACNRLGRKLIVVGTGREEPRLRALAGPTIEFRGYVTDDELNNLYARATAFLFAANEDFGIVSVEAQSYGRPVVAYGSGGSLETVIPGKTGVYFGEQTVESVMQGILELESMLPHFDARVIQRHSWSFDAEQFKTEIARIVEEELQRSGKLEQTLARA